MVGEGSPTEAIALQVDGPRDADHGGARRSKEGRRSLCSQDANDRFWHDSEVLALQLFLPESEGKLTCAGGACEARNMVASFFGGEVINLKDLPKWPGARR